MALNFFAVSFENILYRASGIELFSPSLTIFLKPFFKMDDLGLPSTMLSKVNVLAERQCDPINVISKALCWI
jgi:hypothetical protein